MYARVMLLNSITWLWMGPAKLKLNLLFAWSEDGVTRDINGDEVSPLPRLLFYIPERFPVF